MKEFDTSGLSRKEVFVAELFVGFVTRHEIHWAFKGSPVDAFEWGIRHLSADTEEKELRVRVAAERTKESLTDLGLFLAHSNRHYEAANNLREAIALDGAYGKALCSLGLVLAVNRRWGALQMFEEANRVDPRDPIARVSTAILLAGAGRWPEVWRELRLVPRRFRGCLLALRLRGRLGVRRFQMTTLDWMMRSVENDIDRNLQGLGHTWLGNWASGEWAFKRALELNPRRMDTLNSLGNLFADQGLHYDALEFYERATQPDRRDWRAGSKLALARECVGDIEGAIEAWSRLSGVLKHPGADSEEELENRIADLNLALAHGWTLAQPHPG